MKYTIYNYKYSYIVLYISVSYCMRALLVSVVYLFTSFYFFNVMLCTLIQRILLLYIFASIS